MLNNLYSPTFIINFAVYLIIILYLLRIKLKRISVGRIWSCWGYFLPEIAWHIKLINNSPCFNIYIFFLNSNCPLNSSQHSHNELLRTSHWELAFYGNILIDWSQISTRKVRFNLLFKTIKHCNCVKLNLLCVFKNQYASLGFALSGSCPG